MDAVLEYLGRVSTYNPFIVIIELGLIGFIVYWAVNFLEGTRGERLFRGVIIVLLAGAMILKLVIVQFDFVRLLYIYKSLLIVVLIIAVAAFQPELRRMLIRIGQAGSFSGSSHHQLSKTVQEIVEAVMALSAKSIGAIIVIERRVALGEFIETGVKIDGQVTAALLETIFYPGTSLHDLGVIVRGDKIIAARVQLPLAELGTMKGESLGSRHRAAVGITRSSDAIVVVVSEETGTVSISQDGGLERELDESGLRKKLTSIIIDSAPMPVKFWRRMNRQRSKKA